MFFLYLTGANALNWRIRPVSIGFWYHFGTFSFNNCSCFRWSQWWILCLGASCCWSQEFSHCWILLHSSVATRLLQNMKKLKGTLRRQWKMLEPNHNAEECRRGDPLGFVYIHSVAKDPKTEKGTLWCNQKKLRSLRAEKNLNEENRNRQRESLVCFRGSGRQFVFVLDKVLSVLNLSCSSCWTNEQNSGPYASQKMPSRKSRALFFDSADQKDIKQLHCRSVTWILHLQSYSMMQLRRSQNSMKTWCMFLITSII